MPSDSQGVYSLPAGYLAVTGETIQASQHNPPLEDIGAALTERLMKTGAAAMTGPLKVPAGSAAAPTVTFSSSTNTGFYKTTNGIGVTINGVQAGEIGAVSPFVRVGMIMDWPAAAIPSGYLACQGQSLLRATYPDLFTVIGTLYGAADGTHFSLPDLRCLVTAGLDTTRFILTGATVLGAAFGSEEAALSQANLPSYTLPKTLAISDTQSFSVVNGTNIIQAGGGTSFGGGAAGAAVNLSVGRTGSVALTGDTQSGGLGLAHANVQPVMILNKIIFTGVA